ncbi:hypothetical protein [Paraflavitalea speifideaquila]|uniref:hypothetical protein n=1 Tax=Paraflavitalea speifideaquila TaxID=3076558 RepID=UPI0028E907E1|nr:hypothetical protein [Paraflavitalea speifideiaquila]
MKHWLQENNYELKRCGLSSIPHTKGLFALFYDATDALRYRGIINSELSNEVILSSIPRGEKEIAYLYFNQEGYSAYCREYREYWDWVEKRNENRYLGNVHHGKGYDAKNMMHTIRLLQVAEEILSAGILQVMRPNREELLAIKAGNHQYDDLLALANILMQRVDKAAQTSALPDAPDRDSIEKVLVQMRRELYQ